MAAHLGKPEHAEVRERSPKEAGQHQHLVERGGRTRVDVDEGPGGPVDVGDARCPGVELDGGVVGHPHQRRGTVDDGVTLGLAGTRFLVPPPSNPVGCVARELFVPEAGTVDAVRIAVQVHGPIDEIGQHHGGDLRVVADEVALGDGRLAVAAREEHLVEIGERQFTSLQGPGATGAQRVQCRELGVGRRLPR